MATTWDSVNLSDPTMLAGLLSVPKVRQQIEALYGSDPFTMENGYQELAPGFQDWWNASGLSAQTGRDGPIDTTQLTNGNDVLASYNYDTTPTGWDKFVETAIPLMIGGMAGGTLLSGLGMIGGGTAGTAGTAAAGDTIAALGANQVGALGAAEAAGAAGAAGGSGALTGLGAAGFVPEVSTIASTLGADYGVGSLLNAAGLSTLGTGLGATGVESMAGLEPIAQLGQATTASVPTLESTLGAGYGFSPAASAGLSSADKAALYGNEGYGTGMTGAQTSAYDSILNATGSSALANAGSTLASGASSLADLVGGGSNLAALIGGVAGASSGGGTNTATTQSKLDPVMQQYLYGSGYGDTNSLLGAAQNWYQNNKTGLNSTMQQGLDMSKAALTDPAYAQSYQTMRNVGTGLLNQGVAANPFSTGQATLTNGLLPSNVNDLITAGKGLIPTRGRSI